MSNIENKAFSFIIGHGRGWAFSSSDLMHILSRQQIDNILSDLMQKQKIRRVCRGMYDYPKYSTLLEQELSPDIDQVARAFARKFNWRIAPSGESALNLLGLSTQVPGKYVYLSDGPNRSYKIGNTSLEFKKRVLKEIGFKYAQSSLIVQALRSLGKENISTEIIANIQSQIDEKSCAKILKDTKGVTDWIYETIKLICHKEDTDV